MNHARNPMIGLAALAFALAMPMASAQTAAPTTAPQAMQAPASAAAVAPAPSAEARRITWADLDADKDGALSKTEVTPVPSLGLLFDEADADADGKLTSDEYKAYIARNGNGTPGKQG